MTFQISSELLELVLAQARSSEDEVCGLLIGCGETVTAMLPCRNVAADPRRRFDIDPVALIAAHRQARRDGAAVLGHYHSHPGGSPVPSPCDAAEAAPDGALWLIVGAGEWRGWQAVSDGAVEGRFDPVAVIVTPPCAAPNAPPEERG